MITDKINHLSNFKGNDLIRELSKFKDDQEVKQVLYFTYSPKFVYNIKSLNPKQRGTNILSMDEYSQVLLKLHQRVVTGDSARLTVERYLSTLSEDSVNLALRILTRDLRINASTTTINKAIPDLIEPSPPYMRCSLSNNSNIESFPSKFFSQVKADGMFLYLYYDDGIKAVTRNGSEFPIHMFPGFKDFNPGNNVLSGELLVSLDNNHLSRKESNGMLNSVLKGGELKPNHTLEYLCWDAIPLDKFKQKANIKIPYANRFSNLQDLLDTAPKNIYLIDTIVVSSMDEAIEHYKECRAKNLEGTVIKDPRSFWKDGTSKDLIKMKAEVDIELQIISLNPGKGKNEATFGSILMRSSCGNVECNVSGISDEQRLEIFNNFESYKNKIATVRSNELISSKQKSTHSLFLPRLIEIREDKTTADDLETIQNTFASVL